MPSVTINLIFPSTLSHFLLKIFLETFGLRTYKYTVGNFLNLLMLKQMARTAQ